MGGWIKLHRDILSWEWWDEPVMVRAFLTILMLCNPEDRKWHGQTIKAGSFVTSRAKLAAVLKLTEKQTRTVLSRLKETGEITVSSNNHFTLIFVNNWANYQETKDTQNGQPEQLENQDNNGDFQETRADKGPTKGQQDGRQKADKGPTKGHNEELREIYSPQNTNVFLPPNGEPAKAKKKVFVKPTVEEVAAYCRERGNSINPQAFVSHYEANGWVCGKAKAPMRDWKAAVRLWETYDKKQSTNSPANHASFDYAPDESGTDESKWFQ